MKVAVSQYNNYNQFLKNPIKNFLILIFIFKSIISIFKKFKNIENYLKFFFSNIKLI